MLAELLSTYPQQLRETKLPANVLHEAKRRVLDTLGCYYGSLDAKPCRLLRLTFGRDSDGQSVLWGTGRRASAETAAWLNGAGVRALDFNDTYLSKEPCHPSDLISSLWAAAETRGGKQQGLTVLQALILGYEVMCRLCDAASIRVKGWDHVTYLPIASAVACSYIFGLSPEKTRNAIALAMVGQVALRQTRVGIISDWKAACAAYAARAGLWAARLAANGFTGPNEIFSGRHGFFSQVSGSFKLAERLSDHWMILKTHTKFFPAEHHAQSAIEAALTLRPKTPVKLMRAIQVSTFEVGAAIIGSEKEKWFPTTRETADHSLPYLVAVALLDGTVNLSQYEKKRFLSRDVHSLMRLVTVEQTPAYSALYPEDLPVKLTIALTDGRVLTEEVLRPTGYAGRPMTDEQVTEKFDSLASRWLSAMQRRDLKNLCWSMEKTPSLDKMEPAMRVRKSGIV